MTLSIWSLDLNWDLDESLCAPGEVTWVSLASNVLPLNEGLELGGVHILPSPKRR